LTQLSTANTGKPEENSEQVNEIVAPHFTAVWIEDEFGAFGT
jgi:hypothetical protein